MSFDGIPSRSFQADAAQAAERTQFEVDWLRGLFHTIMKLRDEFFEKDLVDKIDFCVTVPKDRYMEARKADRDGFIYDDRMSYLDWRARELLLMIRKRLDVMNNFYEKEGEAIERLWRVIRKSIERFQNDRDRAQCQELLDEP